MKVYILPGSGIYWIIQVKLDLYTEGSILERQQVILCVDNVE
jgi:hypothetical protein